MNNTLKIKDGNIIEIATEDFSTVMIPKEELRKIKQTDGWRLPSVKELELIYNEIHRNRGGNFHNDWYWSKESFYVSWDYSVEMGYNFADGQPNAKALSHGSQSFGLSEAFIRFVRDLPNNQ